MTLPNNIEHARRRTVNFVLGMIALVKSMPFIQFFFQILSQFIQIVLRFYTDFTQILYKTHFILILSIFHPQFYPDKIWIKGHGRAFRYGCYLVLFVYHPLLGGMTGLLIGMMKHPVN